MFESCRPAGGLETVGELPDAQGMVHRALELDLDVALVDGGASPTADGIARPQRLRSVRPELCVVIHCLSEPDATCCEAWLTADANVVLAKANPIPTLQATIRGFERLSRPCRSPEA